MKQRKHICSLMSVVMILLLFQQSAGCKKRKTVGQGDSGAYSCGFFEVPEKPGYEPQIQSVLQDGENTCISLVYNAYDENELMIDQITDIFTVDNNGNSVYTLEVQGCQPPCAILPNEYVYLGYNTEKMIQEDFSEKTARKTAVFLDKKTGDITRTIEIDFQPSYISVISDGFVIVGSSTIARYSWDGNVIEKLTTDFYCYSEDTGFFEENGKFYVIEEKNLGEYVYHEVNFDSGICHPVTTGRSVGINGSVVSGEYYFSSDGEYRVDLNNMKVDCVAEWNNIDIRPPKKYLDTPSRKFPLDEERFAISYEYRDCSSEVLIFHYDPSIDRSGVETIKIGGYRVYDDPVLNWAVYSFNTTNKDFRVVLEDYSQRFDAILPDERRRATLALTQYFNEGNAPDIYYGPRFDYAYMGRNGMVIDISEYMNSANENTKLTEAAYRIMIEDDGKCYQLFSGYSMLGRKIEESVLDSIKDTSVFSLFKYAQERDILYSFTSAHDIVDTAIRYDFPDLWGVYDGKRKISHEELVELVTIATSLPVTDDDEIAIDADVVNGRVLMGTAVMFCDLSDFKSPSDSLRYIGYPSIHGSIHLAIPQCSLAISASAKNKDKCWEMMSMILSEEAQKQTLLSGNIPVTQSALDLFCDISLHPDNVKDADLRSYVGKRKPVSQETINLFLETISTVDTVATYDWGIFDIINDEINSYFSQHRSVEQITETLEKRLTLYMEENYH